MLAGVVPHNTGAIICRPASFGVDQLDGAFDAKAFLSVVGRGFHLSGADAAGFVSLDHLKPVGATGVRVSLAPFNRSPVSGWVFLLPMRGDDSARCPVLVQKDEALQALGAHLAKGAGLGT